MTRNARAHLHADLDLQIAAGDLVMALYAPEISFQRLFVDLTGSITAALLLSALHQDHEHKVIQGWLPVSAEGIERKTGMTPKQQLGARRTLRDLGVIKERKAGFPSALQIQIDYDEIVKRMAALGARQQQLRDQAWSQPAPAAEAPATTVPAIH